MASWKDALKRVVMFSAAVPIWTGLAGLTGCGGLSVSGGSNVKVCSVARALPSPDGSKIVFARPVKGVCTIHVMASDGSHIRSLSASGATQDRMVPAYSPDGRQIAFAGGSDGVHTHIYVMNADGSNVRQVTNTEYGDTYPSFSPDGSRIVFARAHVYRPYSMGGMVWDNVDIYTVRLDGTDERRLTSERFYSMSPPYFSPGGKQIVFAATPATGKSPNRRIYVIDVRTGGLHELTDGSSFDADPAFSPDGERIVFVSPRGQNPAVPGGYEIWTMDRSGGNARQLTNRKEFFMLPVYTPDGESILFVKELSDNVHHELWCMDVDGSSIRRIAGL